MKIVGDESCLVLAIFARARAKPDVCSAIARSSLTGIGLELVFDVQAVHPAATGTPREDVRIRLRQRCVALLALSAVSYAGNSRSEPLKSRNRQSRMHMHSKRNC